ncbi:Rad52/Rad22 family DNA repair protein [Ktedonospora formicarum]|uniref:Uncharacterized protein n=1 Tax=Ktedonospora formicarum TaxID=2778364 RepID=A0A8J3MR12_9CHLR|nr:Rad52/Rad22 family DNA repair protein [Ktedonospora formicarum]GHO44545.1 hypothetical protein KSX_27080 [Ktedonospora formicarum]
MEGLKTISEITQALNEKYDGFTEELNGKFTYIPWEFAMTRALEIFGPSGLDVEVREGPMLVQIGEDYGYTATVRVTVHTADGRTFFRDGVGWNDMGFTREGKAQIETALKGAPSSALVRALSQLGDAFGLYIGREAKEKKSQGSSASSKSSLRDERSSNVNGKKPEPDPAISDEDFVPFSGRFKPKGAQIPTLAKHYPSALVNDPRMTNVDVQWLFSHMQDKDTALAPYADLISFEDATERVPMPL